MKGWYAHCPTCGAEVWLSRWKWIAMFCWWIAMFCWWYWGIDEAVWPCGVPPELIWKEKDNG